MDRGIMRRGLLKLSLRDAIVFLYLIVLSVQYGLQCTDFEFSEYKSNLLLIFYLFSLLFFLFLSEYCYVDLFFTALILLFGLIVTYKSGFSGFLIMVTTSIMLSIWEWSKVFKSIFILRCFVFCLIICLAVLGGLNLYKTLVVKGGYSVIGYGLGFTHPNRLAYGFVYLMIVYICFLGRRITTKDYFFIVTLSLICYCITKSRTQIICICVILLFSYLLQADHFKTFANVSLFGLGLVIVPFCFFFSVAIPYMLISGNLFLKNLALVLDHMFSGRFMLISRAFKYYDLSLFGGTSNFDILDRVYHYSTVDNGYIRFIYAYGLVGMLIYILLTVLTVLILKQRKEILLVSVVIVISVWALSENILVSVGFNIIGIFWSVLIRGFENCGIESSLNV